MNGQSLEASGEDLFDTALFDGEVAHSDDCMHNESLYLRDLLPDLSWTDIPKLEQPFWGDAIYFLSEAALVYFLPGFLIWISESYKDADMAGDSLLSLLSDPQETSFRLLLREKCSEKQLAWLVAMLESIAEEHCDLQAKEAAKVLTIASKAP